jgi:hypothetical protein
MRTWLNNLLLAALLAAAPAALYAQDQPAAQGQQDQKDSGSKQPQVRKKEDEGKGKTLETRTVKDFKPSEEISEGLSVSFPSDI